MRYAALICLSLATPVSARDIKLGQPIQCELGKTCYIQQYVDRDPGPGAADFTCGSLVYDGHTGTDFALPTLAAMEAGVNVVAAAPGVVLRVRDGIPDARAGDPGAPDVEGQECGNGVIIDHGDGWETQYCHLRKWTVTVEQGLRVPMGHVLGQVGMSGLAQFPHVELVVRKDGNVVDPFDMANEQSCGGDATPLWLDPISYVAGGFIESGISTDVPSFDALKAGTSNKILKQDQPLVVWGFLYGGRAGDVIEMVLTGPGGAVLHKGEAVLERNQAQLFRASGRRAPSDGWAVGAYHAEVRLIRDGEIVDVMDASGTIAPP